MNENVAKLEARLKQERFEALYREMEGAGSSLDESPIAREPARHKTARELREQTAERQWLVRRHNGGTHEEKVAGCPSCWPPGRDGNHQPTPKIAPLFRSAAEAYRAAVDEEKP